MKSNMFRAIKQVSVPCPAKPEVSRIYSMNDFRSNAELLIDRCISIRTQAADNLAVGSIPASHLRPLMGNGFDIGRDLSKFQNF
jgi:hypothetical protein